MEQLTRTEWIIGKQALSQLKNTHVLIIGIGGVGSYALECLVRSGIGKITMVDYDTIDITNLNRQLITTHNNIGKSKIDEWEARIKEINPSCDVIKMNKCLTKEDIHELLQIHPDYIIDACDTIEVKKELIRESVKQNIKIISSMGTGNKLDPTKLQISDIRKTNYDPIAKMLRKMVKEEKIKAKIPVVWSNEQPIQTENKKVGSIIMVPSASGILCASYVINDIIKKLEKENIE